MHLVPYSVKAKNLTEGEERMKVVELIFPNREKKSEMAKQVHRLRPLRTYYESMHR
jgi:hypothetical protein